MALIAEEFGDRVGFLTVLLDLNRDRDAAIQITESVDLKFITIDAHDSIWRSFGSYFESGYIPETVFFDGDGNIITSIVGGSYDEYRTIIENALGS